LNRHQFKPRLDIKAANIELLHVLFDADSNLYSLELKEKEDGVY
jgi:hypothetical protein